ncbi:MAG: 50S ribosomal protein L19 [Candidatus Uhrbacteria bacterium]|nr:50S ribosomal protein L19 [Candidatus Uhrbacteria bacterium]
MTDEDKKTEDVTVDAEEITPEATVIADAPEEVTADTKEVIQDAEEVKEVTEAENQETDAEENSEAEVTEEEPVEVEELKNRDVKPGMVVRVHERIKDVNAKGEPRERVQVFEGIVLGVKGKDVGRTMTIRKDAKGWMVEKIFPLNSPNIEKVEVVKQYRARRAKLTFLRGNYKKKLKEVKVAE